MSASWSRRSSMRHFDPDSRTGSTLWEAYDERRTFARFALDVDRAAVLQDQVLRDREPEAAAGDLLRAAFVAAIEPPENLRALRFRNAVAVIGDAHDSDIRLLDHFDFDVALIAAVLDRVVQQIRERLLDPQGIATDD